MSRSGLPQLHFADFEPQIFWLIVFFIIFYIIIKKIITPYFFSEIESRDSYIQDNLLKIRKLQTQANNLQCEYRDKLSSVHSDASKILNEMKKNIALQIESSTRQLSQEANDVFHKAYFELNQREAEVQNEMSLHVENLLTKASDKLSLVLPVEFVDAKKQEILKGVL